MTRRTLTLVVALLLITAPLAAATPVSAQSTETPRIIQADGNPSFIVALDGENAAEDIQAWANESDARTLLSVDAEHDRAVVAAPPLQIRDQSLFSAYGLSVPDPSNEFVQGQLIERPYVTSVTPNYDLTYAEPVGLINESDFGMDVSLRKQIRMGGPLGTTSTDASTLAFDSDANQTTMADHRGVIGADNVSRTGSGLTIAVLDTGINTANGRLFGNGTSGSDIRVHNASTNYLTGESVNATAGDFDPISDGSGHGTWTASAIGANASGTVHDGVTPEATLLVHKVLSDDGSGETSHIASAVRDAADQDADVISMSLGSPQYSAELAEAIAYAHDQGSVVVVAAGNSRQTARWVASPADVEEAIAVGAMTAEAPGSAQSAYFSQVAPDPGTTDNSGGETAGAEVDVAAPGMKTTARVVTESGRVTNETLSGTSMATPMVAAGVGLGIQANGWTPEEATEWVRHSARAVPNASPTEVGAGMVAVDNLVTETVPERNQSDGSVLTDAAERRQAFHESLSDASGGFLSILLAVDPQVSTLEA